MTKLKTRQENSKKENLFPSSCPGTTITLDKGLVNQSSSDIRLILPPVTHYD